LIIEIYFCGPKGETTRMGLICLITGKLEGILGDSLGLLIGSVFREELIKSAPTGCRFRREI